MARSHQGKGMCAAASPADTPLGTVAVPSASPLEDLYRSHWSDLTRYIASRFGPGPPEPEEVAQAAFARLAASEDIEGLSNQRSYLYTVACNIAIDHQRRSTHRNGVHRDLAEHADANGLSDFSPERVLLAKEQFAVFEKALRAMPKMRRRIFLMVRAEGDSPREVSRRFGMSEGAVHKHVSRALQDCAAAFEAWEKRR